MKLNARRKIVRSLFGFGLVYPLVACGKGSLFMRNKIAVKVLVFNYLDYPIMDVFLNDEMIGGSASLSDSPYGQFSTVTGVTVPFGKQTLTWRNSGTGEIFFIKNTIILSSENVSSDFNALGVHIYPDCTAELIFSENVVEQSERGLTYAKKFQKHG